MIYFRLFTEAVDEITQNYVRPPLALPFSTVWANTRRDASDVMGYTDRVQL